MKKEDMDRVREINQKFKNRDEELYQEGPEIIGFLLGVIEKLVKGNK